MKGKLHPLKTYDGKYKSSVDTSVAETFERERRRIKQVAERKSQSSSARKPKNVHDFSEAFKHG